MVQFGVPQTLVLMGADAEIDGDLVLMGADAEIETDLLTLTNRRRDRNSLWMKPWKRSFRKGTVLSAATAMAE